MLNCCSTLSIEVLFHDAVYSVHTLAVRCYSTVAQRADVEVSKDTRARLTGG